MSKEESVTEEASTNNVGSGHVAGVGVGKDGEPGFKKKKKIVPFSRFEYSKGDAPRT